MDQVESVLSVVKHRPGCGMHPAGRACLCEPAL